MDVLMRYAFKTLTRRSVALRAPGILRKPELLDESITQIRPPARRRDDESCRRRPGCAPAGRREHVNPHVEHRQEIKAAISVRHRDDNQLVRHIQPCN
jgi:hypothetical protein